MPRHNGVHLIGEGADKMVEITPVQLVTPDGQGGILPLLPSMLHHGADYRVLCQMAATVFAGDKTEGIESAVRNAIALFAAAYVAYDTGVLKLAIDQAKAPSTPVSTSAPSD